MVSEVKAMPPTAIVLFGGTGNLATTKLLPALFDLFQHGMLPNTFSIIGLARKELTQSEYQNFVRGHLAPKSKTEQILNNFCTHLQYISGSSDTDILYADLRTVLSAFDTTHGVCTNKLFYLAVTPDLYDSVFERLHKSSVLTLCDSKDSWSRVLVEKPFGKDLQTAQELEERLSAILTEEQIYRVDHYLAKDAIENIIALRFKNSILADSWNGDSIESINLRLFESKDVSSRGSFYEEIGALRDVGQNHMLQVLALLTMEEPKDESVETIRTERQKAIASLVLHDMHLAVRGQYEGYRGTAGVKEHSETETYFKINARLDSALWKNVDVTLESGKAMYTSLAEAVITFRPIHADEAHRNVLRIQFSPDPTISLTMWVKEDGFGSNIQERELILSKPSDNGFRSPEAYERVLYDCIIGNQTRFVSQGEVVSAWKFITPIHTALKNIPLTRYIIGSKSPLM